MTTPADDKEDAPRSQGIGIDLLALVGMASLGYGCWLIYPPAAFIVCGTLILLGAVLMARGSG